MTKAAVATVLLKLPPLSPEAMAKLARDPTLKKYDPTQPRVPKGQPDGGQWARENDGEAANSRFPGDGEGVDGSTATSPVRVAENNVGRGNDAAGSASDRQGAETGIGTQAADASVSTSRPLTSGEIELARSLFGDRIDYSQVRIHHSRYGIGQRDNTTVTPGNNIYFPEESTAYHDDFAASDTSVEHQAHLLHELTHVLQNQEANNPALVTVFGGKQIYEYDLRDANGNPRPFNTFVLEQQAEIVQDYFLSKNGRPPARSGQKAFPLSTYERVLEIGTDGRINAKVQTISSGRREDDRR